MRDTASKFKPSTSLSTNFTAKGTVRIPSKLLPTVRSRARAAFPPPKVTSATPDDRVVGTEQNTNNPLENAFGLFHEQTRDTKGVSKKRRRLLFCTLASRIGSYLSGSSMMTNPSVGVMSRMATKPYTTAT